MNAAALRERALDAARRGDVDAATTLFDAAVAMVPGDPALWNSYGNMLAASGRSAEAIVRFDRALAIDPTHGEATINRAIALDRAGHRRHALDSLHAVAGAFARDPRYWSVRGAIEASVGRRAAAADSYATCLALDPRHARAAHGRARMALERGEHDAVARYDHAVALSPGDPHAWLGKALALEESGAWGEARSLLEALTRQAPGWIPAHEAMARLDWRSGRIDDFLASYREAARGPAGSVDLFHSWIAMLSGVGRHDDAADVAAAGRTRFPDERALRLAEAAQAGLAGDLPRADAILATLPGGADTLPHQARQAIRRGDPGHAERLLDRFVVGEPGDVTAWALRDVCWRLMDDDRARWLHRQDGLIQQIPLDLAPSDLEAIVAVLRAAHRRAAVPVGQSVRTGTQINGALFDRAEAEIALLRTRVDAVVERFRRALPPADPDHPLLRHRDDQLDIVGSWSVRFVNEGRHVEHIHTQGLLSSALHLVVPTDEGADQGGWLELGRAPADLRVDLPPFATIKPRPGTCILFPSTLFHGTRPFGAGERLTAAFDVAPA